MGQVADRLDTFSESEFVGREIANAEESSVSTNKSSAKRPHVFLSYCHDDELEFTRLHVALKANNLEVWWDRTGLESSDPPSHETK